MLIVSETYGRLGNQLWTCANLFAYGLETRVSVIYPSLVENGQFGTGFIAFGSTGDRVTQLPARHLWAKNTALVTFARRANHRLGIWPYVRIGDTALLDVDCSEEFLQIARGGMCFLDGFYFRAANALRDQRAKVLAALAPKQDVSDRASELVRIAREDSELLVGIHIRHGDYRTYSEGIMFYETSEYAAVARAVADHLAPRQVSFLVCSDEPQDVRQFDGLSTYFSAEKAEVDLVALSRCDLIFGPNSSFSQWASFSGGVPLHVLDYRAAQRYGDRPNIEKPKPSSDFFVMSPSMFGQYAARTVQIDRHGFLK
jgi:Glycosyl transferase family 11